MSGQTAKSAPAAPLGDSGCTQEHFPSSWRQQRAPRSQGMQTESVSTAQSESQTHEKREVQVQTDNVATKVASVKDQEFPGLKEFLGRVVPDVMKTLNANLNSRALEDWYVSWDDERNQVNMLYELQYKTEFEDLQCTEIAWNSTGSLVAAAYGRYDHENWCQHRSYLCVWNIFRRGLEGNKPEVVIELDHCLMCITFHPEHPAIIAGGTFNGEIYLWNIGNIAEPLLACSPLSETSHKEPISKLVWHPLPNGKGYQVISAGTDGKLLTWAKNNNLKEPLQGCRVVSSVSAASNSKNAGRIMQDVVQGATSLAFSAEDRNKFLVGTEGGNIFRCSLFTGKTKDAACQIEMSYEQHTGPVHGVVCSPFHRNVFLSCSADSTIRLSSLFVKKPVLTFMPSSSYPYDVSFSGFRPLVFAVACGDGACYIYDLMKSKYEPAAVLRTYQNSAPVYSVSFNPKQKDLLATGDAKGVIRIWQLSQAYETTQPGELEMLDQLSRTFTDEVLDL